MRLVSIDTTLFDKYKDDPEVLTKSKRPYVLVIRLKYKTRDEPGVQTKSWTLNGLRKELNQHVFTGEN